MEYHATIKRNCGMVWINLNYMRYERNSNKEQYQEYKNYPEKVNLWKQEVVHGYLKWEVGIQVSHGHK